MKQCSLHAHVFSLPIRLPRRVPGSQVSHGRTSQITRSQASPVQTRPVPSPAPGDGNAGEGKSLKRVSFEVTREVAVGEEVMVVGSATELGEWDHLKGVKLEWHPGHVWRGSVSVADAVIQYKFVRVPEDLAFAEWEGGDDRTANLNEISSPGISITSRWGQPESYSSATPLQNASYGSTGNGGVAEDVNIADVPTYTARIAIQKQLFLGQHLKLVGSSPVLGSWDHRQAPAFTWTPDHVWQLELQLPIDTPVDWKIVQAVEGSDEWCQWQSGENTIVDPRLLALKEGDTLEVGCTWDGESRASIVSLPTAASAATVAAVAAVADVASAASDTQRMITVKEEAVYGSDSDSAEDVQDAAPKPTASQAGPAVAGSADEALGQDDANASASEEAMTAKLTAEAEAAEKAAADEVMAAKAKRLHAAIAAAEKAEKEKAEAAQAEAEEAAAAMAEEADAMAKAEKVAAEKAEAEQVRAEAEKAAAEKAEAEKVAAAKAEAEQVKAEQAAVEKAEAEKVKAQKDAAEKAEAEKIAAAKAEAETVKAEQAAAEKAEAEKAEAEKVKAEKAAAEKVEAEKVAAAKAEAEKVKAENVKAEEAAAEKAEAEKAEAEKAAAEKAKAEKAEAEKAEAEKAEAEKAEAEKVKAEKVKAEKAAAEKAEAEKAAAAKAEAEKAEAEKAAAEKAEAEKAEAEKVKAEKAEAEKAEAENAEAEKAEAGKDEGGADEEAETEKAAAEKPAKGSEEVAAKQPNSPEAAKQTSRREDAKETSAAAAASTEASGAMYPTVRGIADNASPAAPAGSGANMQWPSAAVVAAAGLDMSEDLGYTSDEEVVQALEAEAEEAAQAKNAALQQAEAAEASAAAAADAAVQAEGRVAVLTGLASVWPQSQEEAADATTAEGAKPDSEQPGLVAEAAVDAPPSVAPFAQPETAPGPGDVQKEQPTSNSTNGASGIAVPKATGAAASPPVPQRAPDSAQDWPQTLDRPADGPQRPLPDTPWAVRDTGGADGATLASSAGVAQGRFQNGDALAAGLQDMVLTPEQLAALAEAGAPPATLPGAEVDEHGTFQLQKGRLDVSEDGSTVVVRSGGHEYDSETGTVTVTAPLEQGPDGLLTNSDGIVIEEEGSVKAEDVADVKPEDEVGLIGRVGAYAGMAAAGLGAATLAGGIAVDLTDVALIAGVYGVATAIGSSRDSAIRAKGAAGPVLSAFVTAADIARRIQGKTGDEKQPTAAHERLGKYKKSKRADVSSQSESAAEVEEAMAVAEAVAVAEAQVAAQRTAKVVLAEKVAARADEMRHKLGPKGMQALEDGVNQVMSTDVQRILKALDSNLSDEDKVAHLVKMLLNDDPSAWKTPELAKIEIRAAVSLAAEHVEAASASQPDTQRAPLVLLAALAMSAVDEMRGVKTG